MERILKDQGFHDMLKRLASEHKIPEAEVAGKAKKYLKELYTEHKPFTEIIAVQVIQYLLSRGYEKTIDVDPSDIKSLTKIAHRYPIAFVMTHKSYIDMLVLSLVLMRYGLPLAYTFAGINMSFLGIGQLGRNAGVIFIKRSFKDNIIYKAILRYFIADLVKEKSSFMWALEGTRSRTGKLVWPKMGILKYIQEAEQDTGKEVKYVPVSIVYDLIPDVKDMTEEGRGKDKKPESLAWFINYFKELAGNMGKISIRLGDPVDTKHLSARQAALLGDQNGSSKISHFALRLVRRINQITPVTTSSLVCIALLSKYALSKVAVERDVSSIMDIIERRKPDALVDRGKGIGESVQLGINLMEQAGIIHKYGEGLFAKYAIRSESYLQATYYANMAAHHLYHSAFIEMALLQIVDVPVEDRQFLFWKEIMAIRDLFKFEFFYSQKSEFTDEIERDLQLIVDPDRLFWDADFDISQLLNQQPIFVSPVVLHTYIDAYMVVGHGLASWDPYKKFDEATFMKYCLFHGGEMQWQGRIQRIESVSKPFLVNGIRLVRNLRLIPTTDDPKTDEITAFMESLMSLSMRIHQLQDITLIHVDDPVTPPVERNLVPGSVIDDITHEILEGEEGPHIAAFFDLDRTLIKGFSAKNFLQTRLLSGQMTAQEIIGQFSGVVVYALGNRNFASLASLGAQGVKGIEEKVFIEVGEEVYLKHLAESIYPESRALVAAHVAKGHTVAIVSAATPYQVEPIARDLGIDHVMCTRMEVEKGKFTGRILEPACWGKGKAAQARLFSKERKLDLTKSFFYTDSYDDLPLMEIVGNPRPINPDIKLSSYSFEHSWPIQRFKEDRPSQLTSIVRTGTGGRVHASSLSLRHFYGGCKYVLARRNKFDDGYFW